MRVQQRPISDWGSACRRAHTCGLVSLGVLGARGLMANREQLVESTRSCDSSSTHCASFDGRRTEVAE